MRRRRFRPFRFGLWLGALGAAAWLVQRYQRGRAEVVPAPSQPLAPPLPIARPEVLEVGDVEDAGEPEVGTVDVAPADERPWVEALDDGSCPPSHPVKAKAKSKLYHLPGMLAYERTRPDRCYRDQAAAEADGFTRSKR